MVVADTEFAFNKELETRNGELIEGRREDADFWRWLISLVRNGVGEGEIWFPPSPPEPGHRTTRRHRRAKRH